MKRIFSMLFCASILLPLAAEDISTTDGTLYKNAKIADKDQYGVRIETSVLLDDGTALQQFIPFSSMSMASLRNFPYCDSKTTARIDDAMKDRIQLIEKKFADRYSEFDKTKDYSKHLNTPGGVASIRVFIKVSDVLKKGVAGFAYSDTAEAIFYGKIYINGLLMKKGTLWAGTIYPMEKSFEEGGFKYPAFSINAPQKTGIMDGMNEPEKNKTENIQSGK